MLIALNTYHVPICIIKCDGYTFVPSKNVCILIICLHFNHFVVYNMIIPAFKMYSHAQSDSDSSCEMVNDHLYRNIGEHYIWQFAQKTVLVGF